MSDRVDLSSLRGKSVIVLGGASGLGLAIVNRFARAGAHVTVADLDIEGGCRIVGDLQQKGLSATFVPCDVTDHESSKQAFEHAIQWSPSKSIDVTALIAGVIGEAGSFVDKVVKGMEEKLAAPPPLRHPALDVNLLGIYNCAYLAVWYMSIGAKIYSQVEGSGPVKGEKSSKSLIFVSSTVAYGDVAQFMDYHASKFGIRGLFRSLRHETPRLNIRTNCLAPYFMQTPLVENALPVFAAAGIEPGKGITFVDMDKVVDTAGSFAVDENVHGRAIAILPDPQGVVDLKDDEEGLWAGEAFKRARENMRLDGNII